MMVNGNLKKVADCKVQPWGREEDAVYPMVGCKFLGEGILHPVRDICIGAGQVGQNRFCTTAALHL